MEDWRPFYAALSALMGAAKWIGGRVIFGKNWYEDTESHLVAMLVGITTMYTVLLPYVTEANLFVGVHASVGFYFVNLGMHTLRRWRGDDNDSQ